MHRQEIPKGSQIFSHKWVDKCSKGAYKSRFTCADVKARYTAAEEEGLDVFVPTPTPEAHNLLEVYALTKGYYARSLDIVAAFLIGADRGASEGKHVYMRAPVEWHDTFLEWLETLSPELKDWYKEPDPSTEMSWRKSSAQRLAHSGMLSLVVRKIHVSSAVTSQGSS